MNQISSMLAQAGVRLPPLTQRIWQLLHDSKLPRSAKVIANMLNVPPSHVAPSVRNLYSRGMIALASHEATYVKGPRGSNTKRPIAQWAAVGQEYELLPVLPTTKLQPAAAPTLPKPIPFDIEKMTLAEAHALYKRLQEFFS